MNTYVVMAYRWDCLDGHKYVVWAGEDRVVAITRGWLEARQRGRYGFAVYEWQGDNQEIVHYYSSTRHPDATEPGIWPEEAAHLCPFCGAEMSSEGRGARALISEVMMLNTAYNRKLGMVKGALFGIVESIQQNGIAGMGIAEALGSVLAEMAKPEEE